MRICFVAPEYITEKNYDGGLANYLGRLCPELVRMGHEVYVVVTSDRTEKIIRDGVEISRVRINARALRWLNRVTFGRLRTVMIWLLQSWALNRVCAKIHRNHNLDLVQYASYTATGLFRLKSCAAVVRLSSYEPIFQMACEESLSLNNRVKIILEKEALQRADAIFCPSHVVAKTASSDTGLSIQVIESPFYFNHVKTNEKPFNDLLRNKKYLLFYGTLSVLKGLLVIAEILKPLLAAHGDLYFVFIGKDNGYQHRPMIEYLWEKADLERGRILYMGQMQQNQIYPILAGAIAVVLPSRIDNLPNTCLEAMASGKVVIGTEGASFEQLIENEVNGYLVPIDSPIPLLAAIEKALSLTEADKQKMGELAAKRILDLQPEIAINRLVDFYKSVIEYRAL